MSRTLCKSNKPLYLSLFPSWKGRQPLRFFMMENLLEARLGSEFPTNGAGPDEDVNVFLAGILTTFLKGEHDPQVKFGAESLLQPPASTLSRRQQAQYYLTNANHRLLYLGLMNRGDGLRRKPVPWGSNETETRLRDQGVGRNCYQMAANLLKDRQLVSAGLVAVLEKLADNFEGYVQVLAVMATRHLGLGASLNDTNLDHLLGSDHETLIEECPPRAAPPGHPDVDQMLDLILQCQHNPSPELEQKLRLAARRIGADEEKVLKELHRT